ncbi:hypothetical protein [Thalassotalea profundi]|uniref:Uncharacterized protein n=1 Tax=Thalassotalea profundi TaxID=2036687 RepID=A0ABQ3J3G0_9GAMM|nr:hypothetical protein [Thalassotalea profundi]GHE98091.1 hypothetical protein GCM10011501_29510 [Thalassotalea profundi]
MLARFIKWFLALLFLLILSFGITLFLALDAKPSVSQSYQLDSVTAQKSKQLIKRAISVLRGRKEASQIIISQDELNALSALLHRAIPTITSDITLSQTNMQLAFSIYLPMVKRYINIKTQVLPSTNTLNLGNIHIGDLSLSGKVALKVVRWGLNHYVQPKLGDSLLTMVNEVTINSKYCTFNLLLPANLIKANKEGSLLLALRDELTLFGDPQVIYTYYQELVRISGFAPEKASLAYYFRQLFQFAQQRSLLVQQSEIINENKAALLALALYFGEDKFELLVGDISQLSTDNQLLRQKLQRQTLLQGRNDLQKHFIYSVALQIFSSVDASDAIGEFKEFLDSNKGGSGFSFADLMADRAGTRLAELATFSSEKAIKAQNILAQITDETLLPIIDGLPENLSSQRFEAKYKAIYTQEYRALLIDIDQRLSKLDLYKLLDDM